MERPSFSRQETDLNYDKKPLGVSSGAEPLKSDNSHGAPDSEKGAFDVPPAYFVDPEEPIGDGDIKHLDTAADIVTTVIHVDDDPSLNPWTFRMFFIGQLLIPSRARLWLPATNLLGHTVLCLILFYNLITDFNYRYRPFCFRSCAPRALLLQTPGHLCLRHVLDRLILRYWRVYGLVYSKVGPCWSIPQPWSI